MNCDDILERLSAWIDGHVSAETDAAVSAHLRVCASCAQEADALKDLHAQLEELTPREASIDRLTSHVLEQWDPVRMTNRGASRSPEPTRSPTTRWQGLLATALVLAFGVLILTQVRNDGSKDVGEPLLPIIADSASEDVARVVRTTGTVEVRYLDRDEWVPVSFTPFACPTEASVRTLDDSLCQVETASGGIVRLDEHATVRMQTADSIQLESGRVWCRSADDGTLQLTPALAETPPPGTVDELTCLSIPVFSCPASCSMQAQLTDASDVQVHAVDGLIDVVSNPFGTQLNPGEAVQIVGGRVDRKYEEDALLAMRWMLPLLATDPREVEAFTHRVLAAIGGAKVGFLYEGDLIALGEPGAVPLLEFLKSTEIDDRVDARQTAARVLSQTANERMTSDLIDLLSDGDPLVRISIASALLRLTGEDQGRPPESWDSELSELQEAISAWRRWRESH